MKPAAILLALGLAIAAAATPAAGAERRYPLLDFDRVEVEGPYQVKITTGLPTSARASGSQQSLDRLSMEVQGSTLRVRPNRSAWGGFPGAAADRPPAILVATRSVRALSVSGSGGISIDRARGQRVDVSVAGSGRIDAGNVEADSLVLTVLGSGHVGLGGHARQGRFLLQGASDLEAPGLRIEELQLTAETAGAVSVAAVRTARVRSTGAGSVTIAGNPACTVESLGSGQVACGR